MYKLENLDVEVRNHYAKASTIWEVRRTFLKMGVDPQRPVLVEVFYANPEEMDGVQAWTTVEEDDEMLTIRIDVDETLGWNETMTAISHEAVHATQAVRGVPFCDEEAYANEHKH